MKYFNKIIIVGLLLFSVSCSDLLEDQLDDPNNVSEDALDLDLLSNQVLFGFGRFHSEASRTTMELTRMIWGTRAGGDIYERIYQAQDFNFVWDRAYLETLVQAELLIETAEARGNRAYAGVAKVLKAFTYLTLVDMFGDVPFTEAINADEGVFNPGIDSGEDIYQGCRDLLQEAIQDLTSGEGSTLSRDIYYDGDLDKWAALARTLMLKSLVNEASSDPSLSSQIEQLLEADIIDTDAEEFTYKYGSEELPVSSRHWLYRRMYSSAGGRDGYLANDFLFKCYAGKNVPDPRWRYYFYRQVGSIAQALREEPESIPCELAPRPDHYPSGVPFCSFDPGFFGRDMGNNDGIPPDDNALTVCGVYPFGGRADLNDGNEEYSAPALDGQGASGAGIEPIWMASFTDFLKAEIALVHNIGNAKESLLEGVRKSVERVKSFGTEKGQVVPEELVTPTDVYLGEIETRFDAPDADQLDVVGTEFWLALWGNGVEAYNLYRRTGKPANIQPMRNANPGTFWRSMIYPQDFVTLNSNAQQKDPAAFNPVFWDDEPADFVK